MKRCPRADPNFAEIEGLRRGDQAKANTNRRFPVGFQGPFIAPAGHEDDARSRQVGVRFYTPWMRSKKQTVMLSTVLDLADLRGLPLGGRFEPIGDLSARSLPGGPLGRVSVLVGN